MKAEDEVKHRIKEIMKSLEDKEKYPTRHHSWARRGLIKEYKTLLWVMLD